MSAIAEWTWLVYMAGDNNLEDAGRADLAEMKRIGSTPQVNVIVQFDTEADKTMRYRVERNKLKTLKEMPGVDCGDPKVLTSFIKWGMQEFPAKRYILVVWNHGGGWENLPAGYDYGGIRAVKPLQEAKLNRVKRTLFRTTMNKIGRLPMQPRAIALDCGSHDYLDNQELRKAVARALPAGRKLDVLGCDACLMNMIEVAYEMKDTARVMVGSEETEPGDGWPYAAVLKALAAKPAMAPEALAKLIVSEYGKYYTRTKEAVTQSALDLERIPAAADAVNRLAGALLAHIAANAGTISLARDRAQKFDSPEYIDLGDFAAQLAQRLPGDAAVQTAVKGVQALLATGSARSFVLANATYGKKMSRATGVSIYFPRSRDDYSKDYADLQFSKHGKWAKLLSAVFKA